MEKGFKDVNGTVILLARARTNAFDEADAKRTQVVAAPVTERQLRVLMRPGAAVNLPKVVMNEASNHRRTDAKQLFHIRTIVPSYGGTIDFKYCYYICTDIFKVKY